jgi:hypothetical protein
MILSRTVELWSVVDFDFVPTEWRKPVFDPSVVGERNYP